MEGWRGPAVGTGEAKLKFELLRSQLGDGAQHIKQEKEDERKPTDPTTIIVKQEEISDVPCKVPKFQYVDFPSLHQCIQQLAIPPLETWIARCPAGWARGRGSRDTAERVPKFKYVDYPSLHHCIQQLSVPPLESWSSRLPRAASSGGIPETAALTPPGTLTERQGSLVLGHKRDRDAALPGPSPGLAQKKKSASDMFSYKALNSLCDTHQPEAGPVIGSDRGEPHTETTNGSEFQRPVHLGPDRASAQIKSGNGRQHALDNVYLDLGSVQMQLSGQARLKDSENPNESFCITVTESVCPFCQKMLTNPEELREHQRSHRDESH